MTATNLPSEGETGTASVGLENLPVFTLLENPPDGLTYMFPWILCALALLGLTTSLILTPPDSHYPDRRKLTGSIPFLIFSWGGKAVAFLLAATMFLYAIIFQFWTGPVGDVRVWLDEQHQMDVHPHHVPDLLKMETVTATSTHPADQTRTVTDEPAPETYQVRLQAVDGSNPDLADVRGEYILVYADSGEPYLAGAGVKATDGIWEHGR